MSAYIQNNEKTRRLIRNIYDFLTEEGKNEHSIFKNFPKEQCYRASLFLTLYFEAVQTDVFDFVLSSGNLFSGHVWLETTYCVIDLTPCQFESVTELYFFYNKKNGYIDFHENVSVRRKYRFNKKKWFQNELSTVLHMNIKIAIDKFKLSREVLC